MGKYYCNGKKGYCDRFVGNIQNAENIDCKDCEYADGSGGEYKDTVTNYDHIKSMSVEEMAEFIVKIKLIFGEDIYNHIQEQIKDYVVKIDDKKIPKWKKKERKFYEQWLLQEVSEDEW